jgi:hypothetical protein
LSLGVAGATKKSMEESHPELEWDFFLKIPNVLFFLSKII